MLNSSADRFFEISEWMWTLLLPLLLLGTSAAPRKHVIPAEDAPFIIATHLGLAAKTKANLKATPNVGGAQPLIAPTPTPVVEYAVAPALFSRRSAFDSSMPHSENTNCHVTKVRLLSDCPSRCSGQGVCQGNLGGDEMGACDCFDGFQGVRCDTHQSLDESMQRRPNLKKASGAVSYRYPTIKTCYWTSNASNVHDYTSYQMPEPQISAVIEAANTAAARGGASPTLFLELSSPSLTDEVATLEHLWDTNDALGENKANFTEEVNLLSTQAKLQQPSLPNGVFDGVSDMGDALNDGLADTVDTFAAGTQSFTTGLSKGRPGEALEGIIDTGTGTVGAAVRSASGVVKGGVRAGGAVLDGISGTTFGSRFGAVAGGLTDGVGGGIGALNTGVGGIVKSVSKGAGNSLNMAVEGDVQGFSDSMANIGGDVIDSMQDMGGGTLRAVANGGSTAFTEGTGLDTNEVMGQLRGATNAIIGAGMGGVGQQFGSRLRSTAARADEEAIGRYDAETVRVQDWQAEEDEREEANEREQQERTVDAEAEGAFDEGKPEKVADDADDADVADDADIDDGTIPPPPPRSDQADEPPAPPPVEDKRSEAEQRMDSVVEAGGAGIYGDVGAYHSATCSVWRAGGRGSGKLQGWSMEPDPNMFTGHLLDIEIDGDLYCSDRSRAGTALTGKGSGILKWMLLYSPSGSNVDYRTLKQGTTTIEDGVCAGFSEHAGIKVYTHIPDFTGGYISLWASVEFGSGSSESYATLCDDLRIKFSQGAEGSMANRLAAVARATRVTVDRGPLTAASPGYDVAIIPGEAMAKLNAQSA